MKLNPYSILLIAGFIAVVSISNRVIENNMRREKIFGDSCSCSRDSFGVTPKMR